MESALAHSGNSKRPSNWHDTMENWRWIESLPNSVMQLPEDIRGYLPFGLN